VGFGTILALDVAKRTGVADGVPGTDPTLSFIDFGGREFDDQADAFSRVVVWLARRLRDDPPAAIALERPVPIHDSSLQAGMRGIILGIARSKNVRVIEAGIGEWRKYFLGVGNMKGPIAKRECVRLCTRLGWHVPRLSSGGPFDHNAAEAGGLWLWACAQLAPTQTCRHEPLFVAGSAR
jgi:hypothetical protein